MGLQEYEEMKAKDPEFYRSGDSLQYGRAPEVSEDKIDRMVAELNSRYVQLLFLNQGKEVGRSSLLIVGLLVGATTTLLLPRVGISRNNLFLCD